MSDSTRIYRGKSFKTVILLFVFIFILINQNFSFVSAQDPVVKNDVFPLQTYDSRFYTVYLNENETIFVNVEAAYGGDFDIFLFLIRPTDTYVIIGGYEPEIFDLAEIYNIDSGKFSDIQYKAENDTIIYIQIVCIANGTDTFYLESSLSSSRPWDLNLYFIPFIPGFPVEYIFVFALVAFALIYKLKLKGKFITE
jgi:hypothetical protein